MTVISSQYASRLVAWTIRSVVYSAVIAITAIAWVTLLALVGAVHVL